MPLPEVRGLVTTALQDFSDRDFASWQVGSLILVVDPAVDS